jgi:hypothetical protein
MKGETSEEPCEVLFNGYSPLRLHFPPSCLRKFLKDKKRCFVACVGGMIVDLHVDVSLKHMVFMPTLNDVSHVKIYHMYFI